MALKGYIGSNTYTCITNIIYEKKNSRCTAMLTIYKDESKSYILGDRSVSVEGTAYIPSLISVNPVRLVPENINDSIFFMIADDADENLKGLEGRIGRLRNGSVETYVLANHSFLMYVEDEKKYRLYQNGEWVEQQEILADKRIWDEWFASALVDGNNPTQQMYKFMKTLPVFKDCLDC